MKSPDAPSDPLDRLLQSLLAQHGSITVVTPNRRLAAALKRDFDQAQLRAGRQVWDSPDILPLAAFIERSYRALVTEQQATNLPGVIDAASSLWLWDQVVAKSASSAALLANAATARQAAAAWVLVNEWKLLPPLERFPLQDDAQAFLGWTRAYQRACSKANVIDAASLPERLIDAIMDGKAILPKQLITFGFDIVTPQFAAFLQCCKDVGVTVEVVAPMPTNECAELKRHVFFTDDAELRACAQWARELLLAQPASRIGIVVPDLRAKRSHVTRALLDTLTPIARADARAYESPSPLFNISLGVPLGDYALVHDALALLDLSSNRAIPTLELGAALRSPFLAGAEAECAARARLDAAFRDVAAVESTLLWLHRTIKRGVSARLTGAAQACPILYRRMDSIVALADKQKSGATRNTPQYWQQYFSQTLAAWGFPGERALSSTDFQVLSKLRECFSTLSLLQTVQPQLRSDEALSHLRRIVSDTMFQPESVLAADAPIQVLGILESAGQHFDALWVTGLSADTWPLAARANPFVPIVLQRAAGVPEASATTSMELDARITAGWRNAAQHVRFSHALTDGKRGETVREVSALISDIAIQTGPVATAALAAVLFDDAKQNPSVPIPDFALPTLPPVTAIAGGASMLGDQAACPFRAFARHRLGANPLTQPGPGLDAAERGTLMHRVLALIWTHLKQQASLLAMSDAELQTEVERCVVTAITEAHEKGLHVLTGRFAEIERERLVRLITEWLGYERDRQPFEVVACEQSRRVALGNLSMSVRLDRVDRLHDGTFALIDYKSGDAKFAWWLGPRPDEPQLPLYFSASDEAVTAVAFARLKRGSKFGFEGVSAAADLLPGVQPIESKRGMEAKGYLSWDVLVSEWEQSLAAISQQFAAGLAVVDPKHGGQTCAKCELHSLCRVAQVAATQSDLPAKSDGDA